MKLELLPVNRKHCGPLGARLRREDAAECLALGAAGIEAVWSSWKASDFAVTMLVDGSPAAMAGLLLEQPGSLLGHRIAQVWLLTAPEVELVPMSLHRTAKAFLRQAKQHADILWNRVDARHVRALRWLEALGFRIHEARPAGVAELPFHLVTKEL
jgi:hypothetical protein